MNRKTDQVQIHLTTSPAELTALVEHGQKLGATYAHVLSEGAKRATVLPLQELVTVEGRNATVTFGRKEKGLLFERMTDLADLGSGEEMGASPFGSSPTSTKVVRVAKPAPAVTAPAPRNPIRVQNTGYMAFIDTLLEDLDGQGKGPEGFARSKHTVDAAVRLVLAKFPGKNPGSVRRVIKVRPRHLERAKTIERYDDAKNRAPRWGWVGPGAGTGFIRRVDELLMAGKHTNREIAEITAREFGRDVEKALIMVKVRPNYLKRIKGIEVKIKRVNPDRVPGAPSKRTLTKQKNEALLKRKAKKIS